MPREVEVYLRDILAAIAKVELYTAGMDRHAFHGDPKTVDAVLHNLEIVGEAAKRVPPRVRQRAPEIEWRKIAGVRDLIAHVYFQVDLEVDVLASKLAPLKSAVERILAEGLTFEEP
jgi:uncharacterized protein with HEPN domain